MEEASLKLKDTCDDCDDCRFCSLGRSEVEVVEVTLLGTCEVLSWSELERCCCCAVATEVPVPPEAVPAVVAVPVGGSMAQVKVRSRLSLGGGVSCVNPAACFFWTIVAAPAPALPSTESSSAFCL